MKSRRISWILRYGNLAKYKKIYYAENRSKYNKENCEYRFKKDMIHFVHVLTL